MQLSVSPLLLLVMVTMSMGKDMPPTPSDDDKADWKCCLACQDAPQAIHPEPTVYPPECFTKCTYTVTKHTAAISKKCRCDPDQEAEAMKQSQQEKAASGEDADTEMPDAKDKMETAMQPASSQETGAESSTTMNEMAGEAPQSMPGANPGAPMMGAPAGDADAAGQAGRVRRGMETQEEKQQGAPVDRILEKTDSPALGNDGFILEDPTFEEEEGEAFTESMVEEKRRKKRQVYNFRKLFRGSYDTFDEVPISDTKVSSRVRRSGSSKDHGGCPDNPFKICKVRPAPEPEEVEEERKDLVPNRHIGPCGRLGPGYLSAYGVNAKTEFRVIYRAKNLTYEVIFPSEIVDWENIDFDKYEKKRVTQIVRQKGGMEAIRKSAAFNTCVCEEGLGPLQGQQHGLQVDELNRGGPITPGVPAVPMPPQSPPQTAMMKERRQVYF